MKRIIFLLFLVFTISLTACSKSSDSIQELGEITQNVITVNVGNEISIVVSEFDKASDISVFQDIFSESSPPLAELGDIVNISFNNFEEPDEFVVKEFILDSEGNMVYSSLTILEIETIKKNNHYEYTLSVNPVQLLSSHISLDGDVDIVYRGFKVECIYVDDNNQSYYFVVSTTG